MNMEYSYFTHFFDNEPDLCHSDSWEMFVDTMRQISEVVGYKPSAGDYENRQGLISSGVYANQGDMRSNDNIIGWDMVVLDIDDSDKTLDYIQNKFKAFNYIMYSSASCTFDKLKMRVIIPLDKRAPKERLGQIWHAIQVWSEGLIDEQTKDMSRMQYVPARYTNKGDQYNHFFIQNVGINLPWDKLIAKFPSVPPEEKFKKLNPMKNLKRKMFTNNNELPNFNIQSPDCKLVNDYMIKEYMMVPAGGHHKGIYIFMMKICLNAEKLNYPIMVDEIVDMAKQLDELDGGHYDEKKLYSSAMNALEYTGA